MMRIKEAILRKKIIQQLNEEWKEYEDEIAAMLRQEASANHPAELLNLLRVAKSMQLKQIQPSTNAGPPRTPRSPTKSPKFAFSSIDSSTMKDPLACEDPSNYGNEHKKSFGKKENDDGPKRHPLQPFVDELQSKLTVLQKRALKVTWKRLSEAPKTSGRGTIHIMEKIFEKMVELEPKVPSLFYKSAFISCCHDRKDGRAIGDTISTTRDHAHILVQYIDTMLQLMFEGKANRQMPSPEEIGAYHIRLYPLGLQRHMWQVLGESMAEVMFVQECVRAYPHAASAWSLLAVAFTDKIYGACKPPKDASEIPTKVISEREDSPSSDSGCPYSNKSSTRDDHSGSEGTSGVDSASPHKEPPSQIGNRVIKLRPPCSLHPTNLSQEALYEPPIDYTPMRNERPLSPPIDYPLDAPEGNDDYMKKSSRFQELQNGNDSRYQSDAHLEMAGKMPSKKVSLDSRAIKDECFRRLHPNGSPAFRKSMVNLHGTSMDIPFNHSLPHSSFHSQSTLLPITPQPSRAHPPITQKHSFSDERSPDFRQRRRNFQDSSSRVNFRSISPNSRRNFSSYPLYCDSSLETFL